MTIFKKITSHWSLYLMASLWHFYTGINLDVDRYSDGMWDTEIGIGLLFFQINVYYSSQILLERDC